MTSESVVTPAMSLFCAIRLMCYSRPSEREEQAGGGKEPGVRPSVAFTALEDAMDKRTEKEARRVVEGGEADQQSQRQGDNRPPDKTIGQVKYADNEAGGAQKTQGGSTRTTDQGVVRDQRGQEQPADKKRAQNSQAEGPAAYAPRRRHSGGPRS